MGLCLPATSPRCRIRPGGEPGRSCRLPRDDGCGLGLAPEVSHQGSPRASRAARPGGWSRARPGSTRRRSRRARRRRGGGGFRSLAVDPARAKGADPDIAGGGVKSAAMPNARPAEARARGRSDVRLLRLLFAEVRRYWPGILAALVLDLAATPLTLLAPVPLKVAVDSVVGHKQLPAFLAIVVPNEVQRSPGLLLASVAILQIAVLLLTQVQGAAAEVVSTSVGERLTLSFRARLFQHAQRLSLAFHDARGTADTIYRIQHDAPSLRYVIFGNGVSLLSACALLLSMAYVTAQIDLT